MKKGDLAKLKNRSVEELHKEAAESTEKLWQLRRDIAGGKVKNVKSRKTLRRDIARILTLANQATLKGNKK